MSQREAAEDNQAHQELRILLAAELFSKLSQEDQEKIISQIKALLSGE